MPVTIRCAVLDDINAILAIEHSASTAAHWTRAQYEKRVTDGIILVSEDESVSGFICARVVAGECEIENTVIAEAARRRGNANRLLEELLRHARFRSARSVWLEVRESNDPARRLYEKHGFVQSGKRRAYYQNPEEDAVLYQLSLATDDSLNR